MKATKEKVKAKAEAVKGRVKAKAEAVKGKTKGIKASVAAMAAVLGATVFFGCSTATPASRATTATYTFNFNFGEQAKNVNIENKTGDSAIASADSSGSTETQTATPTVDVKPDIDVRYNDAIAGASTASREVLDLLTESGKEAVLKLMSSKEGGTVKVEKTDGTDAVVKCENGQCSFCTDCEVAK